MRRLLPLLLFCTLPVPAVAQTGGHYEKQWHTCWNGPLPYACYDSVWVPACPPKEKCVHALPRPARAPATLQSKP